MTDPTDLDHATLSRQIAMLGELAQMGLELAGAIKDQGIRSGDPASVATAFAKVSRSVRQSLLLQERLLKSRTSHRAQAIHRRKARIEQTIERIAQAEGLDQDTAERLIAETAERLELYEDLLEQPFDDIISHILKALPQPALGRAAQRRDPWGEGLGWGGASMVQNLEREAQASSTPPPTPQPQPDGLHPIPDPSPLRGREGGVPDRGREPGPEPDT